MTTYATQDFQTGPVGVRVTEAILYTGVPMVLDATNHWPYVIKATSKTAQVIGTMMTTQPVAPTDAAHSPVLDMALRGPIHDAYSTAGTTENTEVCVDDTGSSFSYRNATTGDLVCGISLTGCSALGHFIMMDLPPHTVI
jgi:hypothetical protein